MPLSHKLLFQDQVTHEVELFTRTHGPIARNSAISISSLASCHTANDIAREWPPSSGTATLSDANGEEIVKNPSRKETVWPSSRPGGQGNHRSWLVWSRRGCSSS